MKRCLAYALLVALFVSLGPGVSSAEPVAVPRFDIKGYRVEGNTLLPADLVRKTLARFTGGGKDFGTVQEALEALQEEYRCRGFSTVHVLLPEQELERGEVWLQVAEGRLSAVKVEGNASFDQQNIRRSIPGLVEGKVPDIDSVSASLSVANENPAKKVSLQLQSGEKQDELTALVRVADERPWRVGLNIENTGSRQTGEWRLGALFQHANLFNLDHLLTLQYVTAPERPSKVAIYSAGYRIPLYSLGDSIDLFGGYSDVDSGTVAAGVFDLKVSGRGIISGIRYNQNLKRRGAWEHRLIYGFDYRIYENDVDLAGAPLGNSVTVHPVSLTYSGTWKGEKVDLGAFVTGLQNIPGWGDKAEINNARPGAPADYRILRYGASFGLTLPGDWQERLQFTGQYTDNRLVPGEQFGLGGAGSVRGFRERELTGDWGHSASQEIYTPDLCRLFDMINTQCRFLGFFDVGHIVRVRPAAGDPEDAVIAAGGVGMRVGVGKQFSLSLDYGIAVMDGGGREQGDDRLHLKASMVF